jgi:hypothetical protein
MFGRTTEAEMAKAAEANEEVGKSNPFSKEEISKQINAATSITEKWAVGLQAIMNNLGTLMTPLIGYINDITDKMKEWLPTINTFFKNASQKVSEFMNKEVFGMKIGHILAASAPLVGIAGVAGTKALVVAGSKALIGSFVSTIATVLGLKAVGAGGAAGAAAAAAAAAATAGSALLILTAGAAGAGLGWLLNKGLTWAMGESLGDKFSKKHHDTDGYLPMVFQDEMDEKRNKIREERIRREKELGITEEMVQEAREQAKKEAEMGESSIRDKIEQPSIRDKIEQQKETPINQTSPSPTKESSSITDTISQMVSTTAEKGTEMAKVVLQIDGKVLGEVMVPILNKTMDLTILR